MEHLDKENIKVRHKKKSSHATKASQSVVTAGATASHSLSLQPHPMNNVPRGNITENRLTMRLGGFGLLGNLKCSATVYRNQNESSINNNDKKLGSRRNPSVSIAERRLLDGADAKKRTFPVESTSCATETTTAHEKRRSLSSLLVTGQTLAESSSSDSPPASPDMKSFAKELTEDYDINRWFPGNDDCKKVSKRLMNLLQKTWDGMKLKSAATSVDNDHCGEVFATPLSHIHRIPTSCTSSYTNLDNIGVFFAPLNDFDSVARLPQSTGNIAYCREVIHPPHLISYPGLQRISSAVVYRNTASTLPPNNNPDNGHQSNNILQDNTINIHSDGLLLASADDRRINDEVETNQRVFGCFPHETTKVGEFCDIGLHKSVQNNLFNSAVMSHSDLGHNPTVSNQILSTKPIAEDSQPLLLVSSSRSVSNNNPQQTSLQSLQKRHVQSSEQFYKPVCKGVNEKAHYQTTNQPCCGSLEFDNVRMLENTAYRCMDGDAHMTADRHQCQFGPLAVGTMTNGSMISKHIEFSSSINDKQNSFTAPKNFVNEDIVITNSSHGTCADPVRREDIGRDGRGQFQESISMRYGGGVNANCGQEARRQFVDISNTDRRDLAHAAEVNLNDGEAAELLTGITNAEVLLEVNELVNMSKCSSGSVSKSKPYRRANTTTYPGEQVTLSASSRHSRPSQSSQSTIIYNANLESSASQHRCGAHRLLRQVPVTESERQRPILEESYDMIDYMNFNSQASDICSDSHATEGGSEPFSARFVPASQESHIGQRQWGSQVGRESAGVEGNFGRCRLLRSYNSPDSDGQPVWELRSSRPLVTLCNNIPAPCPLYVRRKNVWVIEYAGNS